VIFLSALMNVWTDMCDLVVHWLCGSVSSWPGDCVVDILWLDVWIDD
jgi:hypothetical protein